MNRNNCVKLSRFVACVLIASLAMAGPFVAQAAPRGKKEVKPPQPIEVVADEMYFSGTTGELFGRGNVVVTHGDSRIYADIIRGNDKQTEIWVDGKARLIDPVTNITGMRIRYNYGFEFGTMSEVKGKCGNDFISSSNVHFEKGKYTAYNATTTSCPAKGTPDYRVTARKVEIWPGDKMIAHDARVWIQNYVVYSTPKYQRSLKEDETSEYPSFGYESSDGFWIKQQFQYPLTNALSFKTSLAYYTHVGLKPNFELTQSEKDYSFRVSYGQYNDISTSYDPIFGGTDNNIDWVRKSPEFRFDWHAKPVGKLPWQYRFTALFGQWTDEFKSSWHQDYVLYFTRNPIYFDKEKSWTWTNGVGVQQLRESFDQSVQNSYRYNTVLSKKLSSRITVWTGYNYTSNNKSTFAYNSTDVAQEWLNMIYLQQDKKTGFSYANSHDISTGKTFENYFTIYRNLHCWNTYIQYKSKKKEWRWHLAVVRF